MNKRRPRTKREQNCAIGTNREHPGSVTNLSLLLIHHCYNNVTVLHLGNSVTIMQQWCVTIVSLLQDCYKYFKSVRVCANIIEFGIVFAYHASGEWMHIQVCI